MDKTKLFSIIFTQQSWKLELEVTHNVNVSFVILCVHV